MNSFNDYGHLRNLAGDSVPGGFTAGSTCSSLNAEVDNAPTRATANLWDQGRGFTLLPAHTTMPGTTSPVESV
ncbi:hypothetical protein DSL92_07805 [Billgrantia gudaonensis]|uniref:Uncharacterized protein n=1 Tax=Billgrantia gudaonensis TaxID=376427 RepID=A0A3S0Q0X3_9GAMM|nr:hypothetical protein DSL92_07805 [Halomonas gudaonensis]